MTELMTDGIEKEARDDLAPFGFVPLGWFREEGGKPALLIGNVGSSIWEPLQRSEEFRDGQADPLNRWTEKCVRPIADRLQAEMRFPFGDKIWPFQEYAKRAMGIKQSPIGLLIHPEFGLWTAFRAVLIFEAELVVPNPLKISHPCISCVDKPCLNTCPIGAFTEAGYEYAACKTHVASSDGNKCRNGGCLARNVCPIGWQYVYSPAQQSFHMTAFTKM